MHSHLSRTTSIAAAILAALGAGAIASAQSNGTARSGQPAKPGAPAAVIGCIAKAKGNPQSGLKSPSGYVLMNATTTPAGGAEGTRAGTAGTTGTTEPLKTPPGTPGVSRDRGGVGSTAPGASSPRGSLGSGVTYLLDGSGIAAHAGERVEISGQLKGLTTDASPTLQVGTIRTIAKRCDEQP